MSLRNGHNKTIGGGSWQDGVTVTFKDDEGRILTIHRDGRPYEAFRQAVAVALNRSERYRVLSVSTPQTIYRDLQGQRGLHTRGIGGDRSTPEVQFLLKCRLPRELLHPEADL